MGANLSFLKLTLSCVVVLLLLSSAFGYRPDENGEFRDESFDFKGADCYGYDKLELIDANFIAFSLTCKYNFDGDYSSGYNIIAQATPKVDLVNLEKSKETFDDEKRLMESSLYSDYNTVEAFSTEGDTMYYVIKYEQDDELSYRGSYIHKYDDEFHIAVTAKGLDWNPMDDFEELATMLGESIEKARANRDGDLDEKDTKEGPYPLTFSLEDRPLKNMYLRTNKGDFYTNDFGKVTLKGEIEWIDIHFQYVDTNPIFFMSSQEGEPITLELRIDEGEINSIKLSNGEDIAKVKVKEKDLHNFNIEDYALDLAPVLYNYLYFADAAEFYSNLDVEFTNPVEIHLAQDVTTGSYNDYKIFVNVDAIDHEISFAPYLQYHEFSHFVMHTLYGELFDDISKEKNHGGLSNPSSADSWAEGFAAYMAVMVANSVDHYWAVRPSETSPAMYPVSGSLETNYFAWDTEGLAEEFAIASFLWDLTDSDEDVMYIDKGESLDFAFGWFFKSADSNEDKKVSSFEYVLKFLRLAGNSIEYSEVDQLGAIELGKTLSPAYDVTADMDLFEANKGTDEVLSFDELQSLAHIIDYEFNDSVAKEWLDYYDEDLDGVISRVEGTSLLEGYETIQILMGEKTVIDMDDLEALAKDPVIVAVYWEFQEDEYTYDELFEHLKNQINSYTDDDDDLNIEFDVLWNTMSNDHRDFTSFIEELGESNDDAFVEKLARNLLEHGLFMDFSVGNGMYESGEAFIDVNNDNIRQESETFIDYPFIIAFNDEDDIGVATNYERPERRSSPSFPGHVVKGATSVAYFIWDGPRLKEVIAVPSDGYVPVPPGAMIFAGNEDEILSFSEKAFSHNYADIKEQGYVGELKTSGGFSFGFWLLVLLVSVGIIYRKKIRGIFKSK